MQPSRLAANGHRKKLMHNWSILSSLKHQILLFLLPESVKKRILIGSSTYHSVADSLTVCLDTCSCKRTRNDEGRATTSRFFLPSVPRNVADTLVNGVVPVPWLDDLLPGRLHASLSRLLPLGVLGLTGRCVRALKGEQKYANLRTNEKRYMTCCLGCQRWKG